MGNRHHHKKLRAAVRARMAATGETYQQALAHLLSSARSRSDDPRVDLVPFDWLGSGAALATIQNMGVTMCWLLGDGMPLPVPDPRSARRPTRSSDVGASGCFIVHGFLELAERRALRRACDDELERLRNAWAETGHSTPRITLDVPEAYELFATSRVVSLLPATVGRLRAVHYYHEQTKKDWSGHWHRDEGELHVRFALEHDESLEIVRASHGRAANDEERRIMKGVERSSDAMPGAERIVLSAGDACVFDASMIHRATYRREPIRRTIDAVFTLRT